MVDSSLVTQTSYVDTSVVMGTTYTYEVKSVDASGVESTSSNVFEVTIPAS
jgi:fibronectin type 3 domain-containing protein